MTPSSPKSDEGLPVSELAHPLSLVALTLLVLNDHFLKGAGLLPGWVTGKLSDFAGLIFFPLLLTSLLNTGAHFLNQAARLLGLQFTLDEGLRPWKIWSALGCSALVFSAIQISPTAVQLYRGFVHFFGFSAVVTMDPSDLIALIVLPIPYRIAARVMQANLSRSQSDQIFALKSSRER